MKRWVLALLVLFSVSVLIGCMRVSTITEHSKPTEAFYINDFADALLLSTQWYILSNSEGLYEDSMTADFINDDDRGAQVVVVTILGQKGSLDTVDLFNEWGVGKNDMGFMMILYFKEGPDYPLYQDYEFIWGRHFETFASVTPGELVLLWNATFNAINFEAGFMHFYFELMSRIYVDIYGYSSYTYDLNDYLDEQYDSFPPIPNETESTIELWVIVLYIVIFIVLGFTFSGIIPILFVFTRKVNVGGGGSTRGYRI